MSGRSRNSFGAFVQISLSHPNTHLGYARQAKESRRLLEEQLAKFTTSSPDLESIRKEIMMAREEAAACRRRLEECQPPSSTGSYIDRLKESEETFKPEVTGRTSQYGQSFAFTWRYRKLTRFTMCMLCMLSTRCFRK
jgi:hypothetical protein